MWKGVCALGQHCHRYIYRNIMKKNESAEVCRESTFDTVFNFLLAILVRVLLHPEPHFMDRQQEEGLLPEPCIVISNHTGHLDGGVLNTVFYKSQLHTLAAKDRFEQKGFGFILRHTRCIPIDRNHPDTSWVHKSISVLREERKSVAIYPEGRHGTHRHLLPFHSGVVTLAALAQVPVVLVYMDGPFKLFHTSKLIVSPIRRIEIPEDGLTADNVNAITKQLEHDEEDLMNRFCEISK